jgi:hypothetical protein
MAPLSGTAAMAAAGGSGGWGRVAANTRGLDRSRPAAPLFQR